MNRAVLWAAVLREFRLQIWELRVMVWFIWENPLIVNHEDPKFSLPAFGHVPKVDQVTTRPSAEEILYFIVGGA